MNWVDTSFAIAMLTVVAAVLTYRYGYSRGKQSGATEGKRRTRADTSKHMNGVHDQVQHLYNRHTQLQVVGMHSHPAPTVNPIT